MTFFTAALVVALLSPGTVEQSPTGSVPQASVSSDGSLAVYYPEQRQLLIYKKVAEVADQVATDSALALAESQYELAMASRNTDEMLKATSKLAEARRKASDKPASDQSYSCVARYEIPSTPTMAIKVAPCR